MNSAHHDSLETRDPAAREAMLMAALPDQVARRTGRARDGRTPGGHRARGRDHSRTTLARLPVTRKHELLERQKAQRASNGPWAAIRPSAGARWARLRRRAASTSRPAPSTNPKADAADYWRMARAMLRRRLRAGDLVHNSFSYHLTPGAWIMESGAHALGCTTFPGGVGNTELQLQAMAELRPTPTRHAQLPAHPAREGRRDRRGLPSLKRPWSAARPFRRAARLAGRARHRRPTSATPPPTWA
jgi:phenylacetate-CoA ligase